MSAEAATTEEEFESTLFDMLIDFPDLDPEGSEADAVRGATVSTFEEAGVLTSNRGLVVRLGDGSEFQVTIVRSR